MGAGDLDGVVGANVVLIDSLEPAYVVVGVGDKVDVELIRDDPLCGVVCDAIGLHRRPETDDEKEEQEEEGRRTANMVDRHGFRSRWRPECSGEREELSMARVWQETRGGKCDFELNSGIPRE